VSGPRVVKTQRHLWRVHLRRHRAEIRIVEHHAQPAKQRLVEKIERFCPELRPGPLRYHEALEERKIQVPQSRRLHIRQRVRHVTEGERRRLRELQRIEVAAQPVFPVEFGRQPPPWEFVVVFLTGQSRRGNYA